MTVFPNFRFESKLLRQGVWPVAGVDEVGRGPLAGPVVAAAVVLDPARLPKGLNDSKVLTAAERDAAFALIMQKALSVSLAAVTADEIDRVNIRQASLAAMARAVKGLSLAPAHVLVDGNDPPDFDCPCQALVKGDARSISISAASIVAKVVRDSMMRRLGARYPAYGFETNAGYAAPRHLEALATHGPTPIHRFSFSPLREKAPAK